MSFYFHDLKLIEERWFFLFIPLLLFSAFSSSQSVQITSPKLQFDGKQLFISYDVINASKSDQFYVWIDIEKKNGETIRMNALAGDLGTIKAGIDKRITWIPGNDSVFLNEEVTVIVNAEKYVKSYNKGTAMLLSIAVPGLGQTKLNKGKPYWLMGVASYGALAGGLVTYGSYKRNYDSYLIEEDSQKRSEYLSQAEKQANLSSALFVTSAAIWITNLFWVALVPNRYEPLKYKPLTLAPSADPLNGAALLTLRYKF